MGNPVHVPPNRLFRVDDFLFLQRFEIWHNHGMELFFLRITPHALNRHYANFLDEWRLQVVRLNLIGVKILPVCQNDQFLLASSDEHMSALVDISQITAE